MKQNIATKIIQWFKSIFLGDNREPWYNRNFTELLLFILIVVIKRLFLPLHGPLTDFQKIIMVLLFFITFVWLLLIVLDLHKPIWLKTFASLWILFELFYALYFYSNADWKNLTLVFLNKSVMEGQWTLMFQGLKTTLILALFSIVLSTLLGLLLAILREMKNKVITALIIGYLNFFRVMPIIVILMFIYFGLPSLNIYFD